MKIAYLTSELDLSAQSGVNKKIAAQIAAWQNAGHQVKLFNLGPDTQPMTSFAGIEVETIPCRGRLDLLRRSRHLVEHVTAWQPELVYLRFYHYYPGYEAIPARFTTIAEMNTLDINELRGRKKWLLLAYHMLTRKRMLKDMAGFVCMTHEIANSLSGLTGKKLVLPNGINLSDYETLPPTHNTHPELVFLAGVKAEWFGLDKILLMAKHFPAWTFHIIGYDPQEIPSAPANLQVHGTLNQADYIHYLRQSDAAIGTLAFFRKDMQEACPLKVMEYLAYGLPTIIAFKHTDFPDTVPFLLQVPNNEDGVVSSLDEIRRFVEGWMGRRVDKADIAHLDSGIKEQKRLAFFEHIVAKN